jgi:N-methylhydantoinase A
LTEKFICGVDIGGTFTDVVISSSEGRRSTGKADTNRSDLISSVMSALANAGKNLQPALELADILSTTDELVLGSTIGTNFLVENKRSAIALLTTAGFEDTLRISRGSLGRTAGHTMEELADPQLLHKPTLPLVDRDSVIGISERIDRNGAVIEPLDEDAVRSAARALREQAVAAVAVSFLWSTANPAHEVRAIEILGEELPGVFLSASHALSNRVGEYERTVAAVVNAMLGPPNSEVTNDLSRHAQSLGLSSDPMFLNCSGGVLSRRVATTMPLLMVDSGPAGGVAACVDLAAQLGHQNAILCDMGGTTFDVGLIWHGTALIETEHAVAGHTMFMPRVDITSIGAGGGSIGWIDERSDVPRLKVGPMSAGAFPGPASYGRGGESPSVTDANLLLGYIDPKDYFGPGSGSLDVDAAAAALERVGKHVGLDAVGTAAAMVQIVDEHSADLIRQVTVTRGLDPSGFAIYAYGGSGPLHAGGFARALGAREAYVPGVLAPVWSALGAGSADMVRVFEKPMHMRSPWDLDHVNAVIDELAAHGRAEYGDAGDVELRISASLGYSGQVHTIELLLKPQNGQVMLDEVSAEELVNRFFDWNDERYGRGFSLRNRPVEIRHLRALAVKPRSTSAAVRPSACSAGELMPVRYRDAWWPEAGGFTSTPIYTLDHARSGMVIKGPAIVELVRSVLLVHPGQQSSLSGDDILTLRLPEHDRSRNRQ